MHGSNLRWLAFVVANLFVWGVLGLSGSTGAPPKANQPPFANPVDQNNEIIRELKEIRLLLQEQNTLLRAGAARKTDNGTPPTKNVNSR